MNGVVRTYRCVAGALLLAGWSATAHGQVEEGVSKHIPWSGYWFPMAKGELLGPLKKYDALTGSNAFVWEYNKYPPGANVPEWHGYCHGWAAAAVLEKEPAQVRMIRSRAGAMPLNVSDQKAWFTACHAADVSNWYGDRFGDGQGSEDPNDLTPDMLWQLLRMFIKDQRVPLVMDLDPGPEVWNYPVYAYRIEYQPHPSRRGFCQGQLSLWAADDAVPPDFVGLVPHFQTYTFQVQMRGQSVVAGSGQWTGQSVQDHPDFAWYPYVAMPENPELKYAKVRQIISASTPSGSPPVTGGVAASGSPSIAETTSSGATAAEGGTPYIPGFTPAGSAAGLAAERRPVPVSPAQLVAAIANRSSKFGFDLRPSEFGKFQYAIGDSLQVVGTCTQGGYLYLLHVNPLGELSLIYPGPEDDNRVAANDTFRFPREAAGEVRGPLGNHCLKAIVTQEPLLLTGLNYASRRDASGAIKGRPMRLCPTQTQVMKSLLGDYLQGKSLADRQLPGDIADRLPGFAQDEFTFYVGPAQ
jgi:hypothetical protein